MPVYEFECDYCGFISEKFYPSVPRVDIMHIRKVCENCKGDYTHKKLMSASTFQLKGMGWGVDGYTDNPNRVVGIDEPS